MHLEFNTLMTLHFYFTKCVWEKIENKKTYILSKLEGTIKVDCLSGMKLT